MLSDFLHTLLDFISYLWPLVIVKRWENGLFLVRGKVWRVVPPGLYFRFPWFMECHMVSLAWSPVVTGRHDITTKDDRTLSFEAQSFVRVVDVEKSAVVVHDYETAMTSLLSSVLTERLAEVEPDRLAPDKRGRLNTSLTAWVEREAAEFGVEVKWVRFTSFVVAPRVYRLLTESKGA